MVAEKVSKHDCSLVWCQMNEEGDLLEKIIPNARQICGADADEIKEQRFLDFVNGNLPVLITKPKIGAFGLNFQHCNHVTFFPSHSFEQYYQGVRRCWRFGQKKPVHVDIITTTGEIGVLKNLQRKADAADKMFTKISRYINDELSVNRTATRTIDMEVPQWV